MTIEPVAKHSKDEWNTFVREHYPPVGGFMQAWEWGAFQEKLGRNVGRYLVLDGGRPAAAFTLIHHSLPFGLQYGYTARGPVIAASHQDRVAEVCQTIRDWARQEFGHFLFLRLEPPITAAPPALAARGRDFSLPSYYIQPRFNLTIPLEPVEDEILASFHPSTRSNVKRAEKRGVTVQVRADTAPAEYAHFKGMMQDTIKRNSGVNAYPSDAYFEALFSTLAGSHEPGGAGGGLALSAFYGHQNGEPAATHFVLFFGETATYLYGAAYTQNLSSKVTTYLHWTAMQEAKRRGMKYYDLGGIDAARWPKLTDFKRQFRGKEFSYVGNIDVPIRPLAYRAYNLLRGLKGGHA